MKKVILGALVLAAALVAAPRDTRLADAAERGDREAGRQLILSKAGVNAAQGDGTTALHWAAAREDTEMTKMHLAAGASLKAATRHVALSPFTMAAISD